ncbi:hypothetical protein FUAX_19810 [Fulvitalea axinellae]|uniref:DUF5689 domain-containing protein n=1 Tax=Fulvitalea axinellae TaxID=1182444 RepID=A0AAU9CSX7_9BACT|nr:hypothetical protein FUAX_19810 [Fulvitalea axinellae]
MTTSRKIYSLLALIVLWGTALTGCVDKSDDISEPTVPDFVLKPEAELLSIADLKAKYDLYTPNAVKIETDEQIRGIISMDDSQGSLYKTAIIYDPISKEAIRMQFNSSYPFRQGSEVVMNIKGLNVFHSTGAHILGAQQYTNNKGNDYLLGIPYQTISKVLSLGNDTPITEVTMEELKANYADYVNLMVKIKNVEFKNQDITYADNDESREHFIEDANGEDIKVRVSGYEKFASQKVRQGKFDFVGMVSIFKTSGGNVSENDMQLAIRNLNDFEDASN